MRDEDRDPRRELAIRLKARLEADGFDTYRPTKGKVKGDDPVSVDLTYVELAEIVGAIWDTFSLDFEEQEARYLRDAWDRLDAALLTCGDDVASVLHQFGLRKESKNRRALQRRLEMARDYCLLIRSNGVESPERVRWLHGSLEQRVERLFGETNRRNFESGASPYWEVGPNPDAPTRGPKPPGEAIWNGPVSKVDAVHVIGRWYDCDTALKARDQLLEARKALRANLDHPIVYHTFPPPYDRFEIPDPAKLGEFRHIDAMGRNRG